MLYERQKKLLALLTAFGGSVEKTDFMKFLFLYSHENAAGKLYDFVPYQYGPFSFTAYEDRKALIDGGFLLSDEKWQITQAGRMAAAKMDFFMKSFFEKFKNLHGKDLVLYVYKKYPHFAINSSILDKFGDVELSETVQQERDKIKSVCSLNTIGYEGHTIDSYFGKLIDSGVSILCDVRKNPISRKKGFSKTSLENYSQKMNIKYFHLPELGIDSDKRQTLKYQGDYDLLFSVYEQEILPRQTESLKRIEDWITSGEVVVLTCYERLPNQCHRHCVANAVCKARKIERANHL